MIKMNNFERGRVKILIYQDSTDGVWYGSVLEFNLTVDGDDRNTVLLELDTAMKDYLRSAAEIGSVDLLNQEPDPELLALWNAHNENRVAEIKSPYTAHMAATESLMYA